MDQKNLGVARYDAGQRYLLALRNLQLEPEALFWAWDQTVRHYVLVIVTEVFDFAGPLALAEKLFTAYNAAATPPEIDPFILRLHSPKHAIYRAAQLHLGNRIDLAELKGPAFDRATISGEASPFAEIKWQSGDLNGFSTWVYKSTPVPSKAGRGVVEKRWKRFSHAVDRLVA